MRIGCIAYRVWGSGVGSRSDIGGGWGKREPTRISFIPQSYNLYSFLISGGIQSFRAVLTLYEG